MRAGPNVRGKAARGRVARGNNLCARRGVRGTVARGTGVRDRVDRRDGVGSTRWSRVEPGRSPDEALREAAVARSARRQGIGEGQGVRDQRGGTPVSRQTRKNSGMGAV